MKINGVKVLDARKPCAITIKAVDVKNGNTKDPGGCAAALACLREFKTTKARVHIGRVYVLTGDHWSRFKTPDALRSEIIAFDRGGGLHAGRIHIGCHQAVATVGEQAEEGIQKDRNPSTTKAGKEDVSRRRWHSIAWGQ
jgi:hypothetical protein